MKKLLLLTIAMLSMVGVKATVVEESVTVPFTYDNGTIANYSGLTLTFGSQYAEYHLTKTAFSIATYPKYKIYYENLIGSIQFKIQNETLASGYDGSYVQLSSSETSYEGTFNTEIFTDGTNITVFCLQALEANSSIKVNKIVLIDTSGNEVELTDGANNWGTSCTYESGKVTWTGNYASIKPAFEAYTDGTYEWVTYDFTFGTALPEEIGINVTYSDGSTEYVWPNIASGSSTASITRFSYPEKYITSIYLQDKNKAGTSSYAVDIASIKRTRDVYRSISKETISDTETTIGEWNGTSLSILDASSVKAGDILRINCTTPEGSYHQIKIQNNSGDAISSELDCVSISAPIFLWRVPNNPTVLAFFKNTINLTGANYVISSVEVVTTDNSIVSATIGSAGYATFSSDKNLDFSDEDGLTIYTAKVNDTKTAVILTEVESKEVPANTAVVLQGSEGDYSGKVIASADALSGNELQVAATDMDGSAGDIYVLAEKDSQVGFYKLSSSGTLDAGKGYLSVSSDSRVLVIGGEDDGTTGIKNIKVGSEDNVYYNLQGQRVLYPTKGLYIVNGKKVILK